MTKIYHDTEFPFEEIRKPSGDLFRTQLEAQNAGHNENHIWSIIENDGTWTYGPPYHVVNVIGFVATAEAHDGMTYYEEPADDTES
jgi:hypothetical protein